MFFNRVGRFFLLIGGLSGMFFILSNRAMATNFAFLLGAAISLLAGLILIWSNPPPPPPPSERFSVLKRKMINQDDEGFYD